MDKKGSLTGFFFVIYIGRREFNLCGSYNLQTKLDQARGISIYTRFNLNKQFRFFFKLEYPSEKFKSIRNPKVNEKSTLL